MALIKRRFVDTSDESQKEKDEVQVQLELDVQPESYESSSDEATKENPQDDSTLNQENPKEEAEEKPAKVVVRARRKVEVAKTQSTSETTESATQQTEPSKTKKKTETTSETTIVLIRHSAIQFMMTSLKNLKH